MKRYAYYPGCSLESGAVSYDRSARKTVAKLGVELVEIEDWNCCGATVYFNIDEILSATLSARNLAIAQKQGLDIVVPCSACYKNMNEVNHHLKKDADLRRHINFALKEDNLEFTGKNTVRHIIDIYLKDIGLEEIKAKVVKPLTGLRVAPYYGCQILRPKVDNNEEVEQPQFMENLIAAMGAEAVDYPLKVRCCGGSLIATKNKAALWMVRNLLKCAQDNNAQVIITTCPMCQMNLECYQKQVNRAFGTNFRIPVLYFTQLLGVALGIPFKELGMGTEFVSAKGVLAKTQRRQGL